MKEARERNTERLPPKPCDLPQCPMQPFLSACLSPQSSSPRYPSPSRVTDSSLRYYFLFNSFYFLTLISTLLVILVLSFHTRLLYYTCAMRADKMLYMCRYGYPLGSCLWVRLGFFYVASGFKSTISCVGMHCTFPTSRFLSCTTRHQRTSLLSLHTQHKNDTTLCSI